MESINLQLKSQYDSGRVTGPDYARAYTALTQSTLQQAMQFLLSKRQQELAADKMQYEVYVAEIARDVAEATQQDKIDTSDYKTRVEEVNALIAEATQGDKIAQVTEALNKVIVETSYIEEQEAQLIKSVVYNNKIKAFDTIGDTYGTFGAGGINLSAGMWEVFFNMASELSSDLNKYLGDWDATTAFPNPANPQQGDYYRVSVQGTWNLGGDDLWNVGEIVVYSGERWKRSTVSIPSDTASVTVVS